MGIMKSFQRSSIFKMESQSSMSGSALIYTVMALTEVFDSREKDAALRLRDTIARIHAERGPDLSGLTVDSLKDDDMDSDERPEDPTARGEDEYKPMTVAELAKLRAEIMQNLE
jgi:hypothetical protein